MLGESTSSPPRLLGCALMPFLAGPPFCSSSSFSRLSVRFRSRLDFLLADCASGSWLADFCWPFFMAAGRRGLLYVFSTCRFFLLAPRFSLLLSSEDSEDSSDAEAASRCSCSRAEEEKAAATLRLGGSGASRFSYWLV